MSVTLRALLAFVVVGLPHACERGGANLQPFLAPATGEGRSTVAGLLESTALMFVAFAGYGRIATMGEDVRDPERTIPRTIIITMARYRAPGDDRHGPADLELQRFTVLVYYAITNLAALRLPRESRRYSRGIAWSGLVACLLLAFWVPWRVWAIRLTMLALWFVWRVFARRLWIGATTA